MPNLLLSWNWSWDLRMGTLSVLTSWTSSSFALGDGGIVCMCGGYPAALLPHPGSKQDRPLGLHSRHFRHDRDLKTTSNIAPPLSRLRTLKKRYTLSKSYIWSTYITISVIYLRSTGHTLINTDYFNLFGASRSYCSQLCLKIRVKGSE